MSPSSILKIKKESRQKPHECCQAALEAEGPYSQRMHHMPAHRPALMLHPQHVCPWEGGSNSPSVLKQTLPPLQKRPATMPGLASLSMGVTGLIRMAFLHENVQPKALVPSRTSQHCDINGVQVSPTHPQNEQQPH